MQNPKYRQRLVVQQIEHTEFIETSQRPNAQTCKLFVGNGFACPGMGNAQKGIERRQRTAMETTRNVRQSLFGIPLDLA